MKERGIYLTRKEQKSRGRTGRMILQWFFMSLSLFASIMMFGDSISSAVDLPQPEFVSPAVAYQPRDFSPGSEYLPSARKQITQELSQLHSLGFRSLVTYAAQGVLGSAPKIAREQGFSGMVIMGIWDIFSKEEWENALTQKTFVNGYCLGNEGLGLRYTAAELTEKMTQLRKATGKPVTTTEPIDSYLTGPHREWLLTNSDWLFPLAQPFWAAQLHPQRAVDWIVARSDYLEATTGRKVVLKEAGFPSASPTGQSEESQLAFFETLKATGLTFFYFEAFDQPWKHNVQHQSSVESHWGLYHSDGTPKKVVESITLRESQ